LEWEGFAVDGIKDGHLGLGFETVTDALKLDPLTDAEFDSLITHGKFSGGSLRTVLPLKSDGYFRAHLAPGSGDLPAGFAIVLVLDGSGEITFASAPAMEINKGDAVVIPFSAGAYSLTGANSIICRPPLAELARVAE
jgi:mannose-6-phosphate isomerase